MKWVIVLACVATTACSGLPTSFDNVRYNNLVAIKHRAVIVQKSCGTETTKQHIAELREQMDVMMIYTNHTRSDEETVRSMVIISNQLNELNEAYSNTTPSVAYCDIKTDILNDGISTVLTAVGYK